MKIFLLLLFIITAIPLKDLHAKRSPLDVLEDLEDDKDDLSLRVFIRKRRRSASVNYNEWLAVREVLHRRPGVGFDLLYYWDKKMPKGAPQAKTIEKVDKLLKSADALMAKDKFEQAFKIYQQVALYIKKTTTENDQNNIFLKYSVIHSMARALYGVGRYDESLKVYGWINQKYPKYRQVLFEKTWAAFQAGRIDIALGAIAAQYSSYFSPFIEPESYLLQMYLYKKLCRVKEIEMIRGNIKHFLKQIKSGAYDYKVWAQSDIETYSLLKLEEADLNNSSPISRSDRQIEQSRIRKLLLKQFKKEKRRLVKQLDQALAFSFLALSPKSKSLPPVRKLPSQSKLLRSGLEMWAVNDAEDWVDEIGKHTFIGSSQCN